MITQEQKELIVNKLTQKLKDKGVICPMCGNNHFFIADGYFYNDLQDTLNGFRLGGSLALPTIPIVCDNCGFISQHSLGVLGVMPSEINDNGANNKVNSNK